MSDNPEIASLTRWLAQLERQVRDLAIGNPLNRGAVRNAAGDYVLISQLAFGSVAAVDVGLIEMSSTTTVPGGLGWFGYGPQVNVLVTGGRLLVNVAGALTAAGNKCSAYMSYGVYGPGADKPAGSVLAGPLRVGPAYDRSVEVQHSHSGQDQLAAAGTFGLHEDLPEGWYTVRAEYALSFSGTPLGPYGSARNRRILATPY